MKCHGEGTTNGWHYVRHLLECAVMCVIVHVIFLLTGFEQVIGSFLNVGR